MSRRKRAKVSHTSHHYPPLLLSPIVHDDHHHSLPSYPTQSPVASIPPHHSSQTPPPKPSHPPLPTAWTPLVLPPSLSSSPPSSFPPTLSSLSSLDLSRDPFLLNDSDFPDPDAVAAQTFDRGISGEEQDGDERPTPSKGAPPVQRSLSYQSPATFPADNDGVRREEEVGQAEQAGEAVRALSIPPLDEMEDYPNLSEVMAEEEQEEQRRREALEWEMETSLAELLDDAEEEEEEWQRRMQRNRQLRQMEAEERRERESKTEEPLSEEKEESTPGAAASPLPSAASPEADEFAATQVVDRAPNWVESSQAQTQQSTPPTPTQGVQETQRSPTRVSQTVRQSEASPSPSSVVPGEEGGDGEEVHRVERIDPAHLFSRRIHLSNSSSLSPTPVT